MCPGVTPRRGASGLDGPVGEDRVGARARERRERIEHRRAAVEPPLLGGRLDHRVLARHLIGPHRHVHGSAHVGEHVEVRQAGLDHDDVGALLDVEQRLAHALPRVGWIHLVRPAIARQLGVDGLAERPVERAGVLRGVGHQDRVGEALVVERLAHRGDLAVHHAAEAEQLRSRPRLRDAHLGVPGEGRVVVDGPGRRQHAAVAVVGELVEAQVGLHDERVADLPRDLADRDVEDPVRVDGAASGRIALGGNTEEHEPADAGLRRVDGRATQRVERVLHLPRHRRDRPRLGDALAHEHRQHELCGSDARLRHQAAHRRRLAQATRAVGGEAHSRSSRRSSTSVGGICSASVVGGGTGMPASASMSDSTVRSGATTWIGRSTPEAS